MTVSVYRNQSILLCNYNYVTLVTPDKFQKEISHDKQQEKVLEPIFSPWNKI